MVEFKIPNRLIKEFVDVRYVEDIGFRFKILRPSGIHPERPGAYLVESNLSMQSLSRLYKEFGHLAEDKRKTD